MDRQKVWMYGTSLEQKTFFVSASKWLLYDGQFEIPEV